MLAIRIAESQDTEAQMKICALKATRQIVACRLQKRLVRWRTKGPSGGACKLELCLHHLLECLLLMLKTPSDGV